MSLLRALLPALAISPSSTARGGCDETSRVFTLSVVELSGKGQEIALNELVVFFYVGIGIGHRDWL